MKHKHSIVLNNIRKLREFISKCEKGSVMPLFCYFMFHPHFRSFESDIEKPDKRQIREALGGLEYYKDEEIALWMTISPINNDNSRSGVDLNEK